MKEVEPWSILTHSRSTWAITLPKEDGLLKHLIQLQSKLSLFPTPYFRADILEPSELLRQVYMLEACHVSYPSFDLVSLYSLGIGYRYIKHLKMEGLEDRLLRDWREIFIEIARFNKKAFLDKGDLLFPDLVRGSVQ